MNLSEYQLTVELIQEVKEPTIAIMIANDALELGKTVFNLQQNINEYQKKINEAKYHIDYMTKEQVVKWIYCPDCDNLHENDDDWGELEVDDAIDMAREKKEMFEEDLFAMMEDYEFLMGKPYNIDYIIENLVNTTTDEVVRSFKINYYKELKKKFNSNEEHESTVIIKTIKSLLNECNDTNSKQSRFIIVECIMCIISNSPIFMNRNINFKDRVMLKMNELSEQIHDINYNKTEYYNYIEKIRNF